jgi:hypothetical protein
VFALSAHEARPFVKVHTECLLLLDGRNSFFYIWESECRLLERSLSPCEHTCPCVRFSLASASFMWFVYKRMLRRLMVTSLKAVTIVVPVNLLAGWNIFMRLHVLWTRMVVFLIELFGRKVVYNFTVDRSQTRYLNTTGKQMELKSVYLSLKHIFKCWKERRCSLLLLRRGAATCY